MNIEKAVLLLNRAKMETKDATTSEVYKLIIEMVHELSIARSEIALLTIRLENLEGE